MEPRIHFGVIGGMGPLASAAFVRSFYGLYRGQAEQALPSVTLYSDPLIADRTTVLLGGGDYGRLLLPLGTSIRRMLAGGVERIVICCMTAHYLLPLLPAELQKPLVSLVDMTVQELTRVQRRCLIACTTGASRLLLFQRHPQWEGVSGLAVFPDLDEQEDLHAGIYRLKQHHETEPLTHTLRSLATKYKVDAILAGCTELHLLAPACAGDTPLNLSYEFIDPLTAVARLWMEEAHAAAICS